MNVLSLFDGMSCGQIALNRAGIDYDNYFASEIDKYAIKVAMTNYPNTIQLGNVSDIQAEHLPKIDLLWGGSPCQGFSFAGRGLNFEDPRSKLFFEFVRLLEEVQPKWFLLENVIMKKEYEQVISKYLKVDSIQINSSLVSAQNRRRLYWTNIPNVVQPKDRNITWGDIREYGVKEGHVYYSKKALDWIVKEGTRKGKVLKIHKTDEKFQTLEASGYKKYSSQRFFGIIDNPSCIVGRKLKEFGKGKDDTKNVYQQLEEGFHYRYLTPIECERLQTVSDNYTACVSDTQRYKMLGNGWTVDVIVHIIKSISS